MNTSNIEKKSKRIPKWLSIAFTIGIILVLIFYNIGKAKLKFNPTSNDWTKELQKYLLTYKISNCPDGFNQIFPKQKSNSNVSTEMVCNKGVDNIIFGIDDDNIIVSMQRWSLDNQKICTAESLASVFAIDENKIKDTTEIFGRSFMYVQEPIEFEAKGKTGQLVTSYYCKEKDQGTFVQLLLLTNVK